MAQWKKVVVSGSSAELAALKVDNLTSGQVVIGGGSASNLSTTAINGTGNIVATTAATGLSHSGSFSGSFFGDGSGLSGVAASFPITQKDPLAGTTQVFVNDGASKYATVSQFNSASYVGLSGDITATSTGVVTIANNAVTTAKIATSLGTLGTNNFTGSFTGSFTGDGSNLTGIATNLTTDADSGGPQTVSLQTDTLDIAGGTNITTTVGKVGNTVTVTANLDNTLTGDITFSGDVITIQKKLVVQGTASFQNTTNLEVADRFVLLASGSNSTGDGGIVIQQATQDVGELFGWDSGQNRWAVTGSFTANQSSFTPDAYLSLVVDEDNGSTDVAKYQKRGNIKIDTNDDIWIYA
jgi:hypothetical protein